MAGVVRTWLVVGVMGVMGCGYAFGEDGPVWRGVEGLPEGVSAVVSVRSPEALKAKTRETLEAWGLPIGVGWVMERLGLTERVVGVVEVVGLGEGWQRGPIQPAPPRALREIVAEQDVVVMVDQRGLGGMKRAFAAVAAGVVVRQKLIDHGIDAGVATSAGNGVSRWARQVLEAADVVVIGWRRAGGVSRLTVAAQASAAKRWLAGGGLVGEAGVFGGLPERAYVVRGRVAWPGMAEGWAGGVKAVTGAWYVPSLAGLRASGPIEAAVWVEGEAGVKAQTLERRWRGWVKGIDGSSVAWPPMAVPGREPSELTVRSEEEGIDGAWAWRLEAGFTEAAYERYDPLVMLMDGASLTGVASRAGDGLLLTVGREPGFVAEAIAAGAGDRAIGAERGGGATRLVDLELSVAGVLDLANLYLPLMPGRLRLPVPEGEAGVVSVGVSVLREGWRSGVVVATVEVPDSAGAALTSAGWVIAQRAVRAGRAGRRIGGEPGDR
ncbi:MAG: hypothetical protein AAGI68_01725 [Planctomycetota bacterium]